MRLHEAAPKLIIQERVGDKVKVSSYWPVPELTRAELALGRLQQLIAAGCFLLSQRIHSNIIVTIRVIIDIDITIAITSSIRHGIITRILPFDTIGSI